MIDTNWPDYCSLIGCTDPSLRPHHHHMFLGLVACTCGNVDQPGTKPKEKNGNS